MYSKGIYCYIYNFFFHYAYFSKHERTKPLRIYGRRTRDIQSYFCFIRAKKKRRPFSFSSFTNVIRDSVHIKMHKAPSRDTVCMIYNMMTAAPGSEFFLFFLCECFWHLFLSYSLVGGHTRASAWETHFCYPYTKLYIFFFIFGMYNFFCLPRRKIYFVRWEFFLFIRDIIDI